MGTKYPGIASSGYNAGFPSDDGAQVASNLVTWAGVKTKLADPIKTLADAENTALVAALDLSARAISSPDTAIASDHWKTLQVTGSTTITLSSAASMGAGYEVGVFNAGTGVVTVTPGAASDTINGVSASVTVSIKGTKIFRTNQALTGYNIVGGYDPTTTSITNSLGADVLLSSTGLFFDGPSIAQGTVGTWYVTGTVTLVDTAGAASFNVKLWDGTTIIASCVQGSSGALNFVTASLSGFITSPAANLKISVKDGTSTSGKILFNQSANSKDSTISAIRIDK